MTVKEKSIVPMKVLQPITHWFRASNFCAMALSMTFTWPIEEPSNSASSTGTTQRFGTDCSGDCFDICT